jgi:hypothetical protein
MTEAGGGMIDAKELYYNLIKQLGMEATDNQGNKLRQHPRFTFDAPERNMLVQVDDFDCSLSDVSVGGISFMSTHNFNIGRRLSLDFEGNFTVDADVMRVVAQDRDEESGSKAYLHGCKFLHEGDGYRCTVMVLNQLIKIMRQ